MLGLKAYYILRITFTDAMWARHVRCLSCDKKKRRAVAGVGLRLAFWYKKLDHVIGHPLLPVVFFQAGQMFRRQLLKTDHLMLLIVCWDFFPRLQTGCCVETVCAAHLDGELQCALMVFNTQALLGLSPAKSEWTRKEGRLMFKTARPSYESCKTDRFHVKIISSLLNCQQFM